MYYYRGSFLAVLHACLYDFEDLTQNSGWTVGRGILRCHEIQIAAELHISAEPSLPAVTDSRPIRQHAGACRAPRAIIFYI